MSLNFMASTWNVKNKEHRVKWALIDCMKTLILKVFTIVICDTELARLYLYLVLDKSYKL